MLRLLCALMLAIALFVVPASIAPQSSGQAQAEPAAKKEDGKEAKKKEKKKAATKKERTEKQKAATERRKRCSAEYQEAKKSGKLAKDKTWRKTYGKFLSECSARLKKSSS